MIIMMMLWFKKILSEAIWVHYLLLIIMSNAFLCPLSLGWLMILILSQMKQTDLAGSNNWE